MSEMLQKVDHSALRTNQAFIIGLLLAAFVGNAPWAVYYWLNRLRLPGFVKSPPPYFLVPSS